MPPITTRPSFRAIRGRSSLPCARPRSRLSAYAILDRVRIAGISHPPTVYRALNELIQLGMVHRLQSRSAFVACDHGACNGKAAFAICRQCEKVVEISLSDRGRAGAARALAEEHRGGADHARNRRALRSLPPGQGDVSPAATFATLIGRDARPWTREAASAMSTRELALASPRQGFSLLRLSVPARLAIVGAIAALLWAFVWLWALR